MTCDYCGHEYDPVRYRWLCPVCGWKANCCEGEPQHVEMTPARFLWLMHEDDPNRPPREYATCGHCGDTILRFVGGMWEHAIDSFENWDHVPEPDAEPLVLFDEDVTQTSETTYKVWVTPEPMQRQVRPDEKYL